jgi:hypothetical protein
VALPRGHNHRTRSSWPLSPSCRGSPPPIVGVSGEPQPKPSALCIRWARYHRRDRRRVHRLGGLRCSRWSHDRDVGGCPARARSRSPQVDHSGPIDLREQFKSLKGQIQSQHGMAPNEDRRTWALRHDDPMVAPNYSAIRSKPAKPTSWERSHRPRKRPGSVASVKVTGAGTPLPGSLSLARRPAP